MKRNKKILLSFLALNTIFSAYSSSKTNFSTVKSENLYNKMTKNIDSGKSNKENYKLIESILSKRNRELKDLYMQNDYTLKPEYLEWQIFFSGFYGEKSKGDNTSENAAYSSKVEGYYEADGSFKKTSSYGKSYRNLEEPKEIDLGVSIPVSGLTRPPLNLNIGANSGPAVNGDYGPITIAAPNVSPGIVIDNFQPVSPSVGIDPPFLPPVLNFIATGFGQGSSPSWSLTSDTMINNYDSVNATSPVVVTTGTSPNINGDITYVSSKSPSASGTFTGTTAINSKPNAIINSAAELDVSIDGEWTVNNNSPAGQVRFISLNPYYVAQVNKVDRLFEFKGTLTLNNQGVNPLTGVEHQLLTYVAGNTANATSIFKNTGDIILNSGSYIVGINIDSEGTQFTKHAETINEGKIIIKSDNSIGIDHGAYYATQLRSILKSGYIQVGGHDNYGLRVFDIKTGSSGTFTPDYFNETYIDGSKNLYGGIVVEGEKNVGFSLATRLSSAGAATTDYISNITNLNIQVNGEKGIGILRNGLFNTSLTNDITFNSTNVQSLTFGENSNDSVLIRSDRFGLVLDNSLSNVIGSTAGGIDTLGGVINTGSNNTIFLANGSAQSSTQVGKITNNADLTVTDTAKNTKGIIAYSSGEVTNNAVLINNSTRDRPLNSDNVGAVGMGILESTSKGTNSLSGKLLMQNTATELSIGVYNEGTFVNSGEIEVQGNKGIGIYSKGSTSSVNASGTVTINGENSVGLFSEGATNFNIGNLILNVDGKDAYAFYGKNGGNFKVTDNSTVNVGAGSIAFQYVGSSLSSSISPSDISSMFSITTGKTLTFNLDPESYAMVIQNAQIDLSSLGNYSSIMPTGINMTGSDKVKIYKGSLIIDEDSNIDSSATTNVKYRDLPISSSKITLNSGKTLSGTEADLVGLGQENDTVAGISNTDMALTNNGSIILTGAGSVGMYTKYGTLNNAATGQIKVSDNGVGLYGTDNSITTNKGLIEFGDNGIGIYGANVTPGTTAVSGGNGDITITQTASGIIKSTGLNKAYGIVANNSTGGTSVLTMDSGSKIDLSSVTNASVGDLIGIYAKGTTVNSHGEITIGNNGIGMYVEDGALNFTGTMNINGNNALGFYLQGNTDFTGTGIINVAGQGVTIFNLNTNPSALFTNSLTINTIGSGTYTLGSISNGTYYYNDTTTLSENGVMLTGKNSTILYDTNANINTAGNGNIGIYVAGINGTAISEAVNRGRITFNDSSAGLYGVDGASVQNDMSGVITVGNMSTGLYAKGLTSNALNSGTIILGNESQGIYLKDGVKAENTGTIISSGSKAVGIYADNVTGPVRNSLSIELNGDNSIGIYTLGGIKTIENSGTIKIGDSSDINNPSIGIFTQTSGDTINNTGSIETGHKSIGIYAEGAAIHQDGAVRVGSMGTGVYTKGGSVNIGALGNITVDENESVGIYGTNAALISNNGTNIAINNGSYGFILETGSSLDNYGTMSLANKGTAIYTDGVNTVNNFTGADITMSGDNNVGIYAVNGGTVNNNADLNGNTGKSNIGIYSKDGTIINSGTISVGNSVLVYGDNGKIDYTKSGYAVGLYGDGSNIDNTGQINIGENAIGLYTGNNPTKVINRGNITGTGTGATGIFVDNGEVENAAGTVIEMTGDNTIGMVANRNGTIVNNGIIKMTGDNVTGMFANINSKAINNGTIDMSGATGESKAFLLGAGSVYENNAGAVLNLGENAVLSGIAGAAYDLPSIVNAGIIEVDGTLAIDGISISIKVDPKSVVYQDDPATGPQFVSKGASIVADTLNASGPISILPGFADGTNSNVYKLENVVKADGGTYKFASKSLLWEATPEATGTGANVYMKRKAFTEYTDGLWFEEFGKNLENNFLGSTGDKMKIYNKTAYIENESEFRQIMASMAGNIYSNMNQREDDIARTFEDSLDVMKNSANNTKENIKINIIGGKGRTKEKTDGVVDYDYTTAGIQALREVERTYKHTFGYSLGYLFTGFEFKDGNESKEDVNTIQMGLHNKYNANGWNFKNDLTGRVSIHNIDRNIDWPSPLGRSEMNGSYETYSITSNNIIGKEFELGKNLSIMPYGGIRAMYAVRPTFSESGLESLKVEGNDAWSVKPKAGVEINTSIPLGRTKLWQVKGTLDFGYEYELSDLNKRERAKLTAVEDRYHKLSKPEDEKGAFRTKALVGVEVQDKYGVYLTGEYQTGEHERDDYRAGVILKAVF